MWSDSRSSNAKLVRISDIGIVLNMLVKSVLYIPVCNVDGVIYQNNEKIPTDNPCEVRYTLSEVCSGLNVTELQ